MIVNIDDLKNQENEDVLLQAQTTKRAAIESLIRQFGGTAYTRLSLQKIKDISKETMKTIGGTIDFHSKIDSFKTKEKLIFWLSDELFK